MGPYMFRKMQSFIETMRQESITKKISSALSVVFIMINFAILCACIVIAFVAWRKSCKIRQNTLKIKSQQERTTIDYTDMNVCPIAREVYLRKFQFRQGTNAPFLH